MPYKLSKQGDKYCVVKEDGESKGCSATRAQAVAHMRALYSAENKEVDPEAMVVKGITEFETEFNEKITAEEIEESLAKGWNEDMEIMSSWTPATSYAQLDEEHDARERMYKASDLIQRFPMLAQNVMRDPTMGDKSSAITALADELAARLQALDSVENESMKETSELSQDTPVKKSWLDKVADKVSSMIGVSNIDTQEQKELAQSSMMVFKGEDDKYMWIARYSNNFRDEDVTPEIISAGSHRQFVDNVDKGLVPYPELWLWHRKEWNIGRAHWVAYDDEGFALAAGHFNPGCEQVAVWLEQNQDGLAVSHGMPVKSIVRDPDDPSVIVHHITSEISPLPSWAAANKRTGFLTSKRSAFSDEEVSMIPQGKKEALKKMGLTDDLLNSIEAMNATDAAKATAEGVEAKENEAAAPPDAAAVTPPAAAAPVAETPPVEETPKEDKPDEDEEAKELPITRKEIADAFATVFQPFSEKMTALEASFKELQGKLDSVDKAVKEQDTLNQTPAASLAAMFAESSSRSKATQVLADDPLLNMKPKERAANAPVTGIPFIDSMLTPGQ